MSYVVRTTPRFEKEFKKLGLSDIKINSADSLCTETIKSDFYVNGKKIKSILSNGTNKKCKTGRSITQIENAEMVYIKDGSAEEIKEIDLNRQRLCRLYSVVQ